MIRDDCDDIFSIWMETAESVAYEERAQDTEAAWMVGDVLQ